jgi:SAM-dependent methyltransferase
VGFDISEEYIASAKTKYEKRGVFLVGTAEQFLAAPDKQLNEADLVLCNGLLHHLEDREVINVLQLAKQILKPAGRLVCLEPVFLIHQGPLSKWIMSRDRGRNIRTEAQWKNLINQVFSCASTNIATKLIRIPYVHMIMECRRNGN